MMKLNLPDYPIKTKKEKDLVWIFDQCRRKFVVLTPEEWVRQHFLNYLIYDLNYPKALIKVESGLKVNKMDKRTDIMVYNRQAKPFLLVECKSAEVALSGKVFDQLSVYNKAIRAQYLVITNGIKHYCCGIDYSSNSYHFQDQIPAFEDNL